jgi:L-malate glycosyltransferase
MNILFTNFHPGNGGGHTTYLDYLFNGISNRSKSEFNLYIGVPKSSKLNYDLRKNYPTRVFDIDFPGKPKDLVKIIKNINTLAKIIKKYNIDIIHTNGTPDHKIAMICKWLYRFKYKIIRTKHDSSNLKRHWFAKQLYKKYTDHLIVVSNYQNQQLVDPIVVSKTSVIHNGVDLNYYCPKEKSKSLIKDYQILKDNIVFVSVAGTALHKGWPLLVKALSRLNQLQIDKIKIIVAGNLPSESIFNDYVKKYNLEDNVIFTGFISDVRDLISIADIGFVLSSRVETISFACREMMAMGIPVLVSDYAGLPENIINGEDGWVVKKNSIDEIEFFLNSLSSVDKSKFSNLAYQKAKNEFGLQIFLDKTIDIYYSLA